MCRTAQWLDQTLLFYVDIMDDGDSDMEKEILLFNKEKKMNEDDLLQ